MKTDTSVGPASGFPIPGAVSFQLHHSYLNAPSGMILVVVVASPSALVSRCHCPQVLHPHKMHSVWRL